MTQQTAPPAREPLRYKDLLTAAGLERFSRAFQSTSDEGLAIQAIARNALKRAPEIGDVRVGKTSEGGYYDYMKHNLAVSSSDPDVFRHESEHAVRLRGASDIYKKLLTLTKRISNYNNVAALPVSLAMGKVVEDADKRKKLLTALGLVSSKITLPNLIEEIIASGRSVYHSPDKLRTATNLAGGLASHSLTDLTAPGIYLGLAQLNK